MTKDLLIIGAVVALVAIMILAALPEITSAMPEVYYVEPTEPETAVEAKAISIHALRGEGDGKNIQICNAMLVHSAYKTVYFCDSCAFYLT